METPKNARFAFVIAEPPKTYSGTQQSPLLQWQNFQTSIKTNLPPSEETLKIHDNVWLIPLKSGMPFLTKLFDWAYQMRIPLHILFLNEKPDWIEYPPDEPTDAKRV